MIKQFIIIRSDLKNTEGHKVRTGKIIAQACHASMAFLSKKVCNGDPFAAEEWQWLNGIFTKVCLKVNNEKELLEIFVQAKEFGLNVHLITDNGLTEFGGVATHTCLAIGPHEEEKVNPITKHLSTY